MKMDVTKFKTYCIVCRREIPAERMKQRSNTCQKPCAMLLKKVRRMMAELRRCRFCWKPSTPDERKLYQRWVRSTRPEEIGKRGRPKKEESK